MIRAVREELASLELAPAVIERNVEAARRAYAGVRPLPILAGKKFVSAGSTRSPTYAAPDEGTAIIYSPGNSVARHTGSWRIFRPVIQLDDCTQCMICLVRCPDAAISLNKSGYPVIDYDNCKGCMICFEECPPKCIREEREVRAW